MAFAVRMYVVETLRKPGKIMSVTLIGDCACAFGESQKTIPMVPFCVSAPVRFHIALVHVFCGLSITRIKSDIRVHYEFCFFKGEWTYFHVFIPSEEGATLKRKN